MFKLSEKYQIDRRVLKRDYIRSFPSEITTINTTTSQTYIKIPTGDSINSLFSSYLRWNFDVLDSATNDRYADGDDIRLVTLGATALFSIYKLTTSSGKHIKEISHAHIVCLMYKLTISSRNTDDLSIGFDRDCNRIA